MSSYLCFICHNTVNLDTNDETREKYREVVGINLCPDSQLCYICHHMVNKLWMFKSICLKRSLEYPVLFSEKGTINLQRNDIETIILCSDEYCLPTSASQLYIENRDHSTHSHHYYELEDEYNKDEIRIDTNICTEIKEKEFNNDIMYNDNDNFDNDNVMIDNKNDCLNNDFDVNNVCDETKSIDEINDSFDYEGDNCVIDGIDTEISNTDVTEISEQSKKKTKSKKSKKKEFDKIVLSLEEQKSELEAQRRSKKYIEAEFKCYSCALPFLFKDTYQAHMMRHEESNGEHVCGVCSLRFACLSVLRSHTTVHSVRYRCVRCGSAHSPRRAHTHARRCRPATSSLSSPSSPCQLCGRLYRDASSLQQHLRRFHFAKTSNRTYSCSVCGKTYNNQAAVRTHMITHIHQKFECDQCPSTFSSPYTLNQHKKKHSITPNDKVHNCEQCGVGYSTRKSLLAHFRNSSKHQQNPQRVVPPRVRRQRSHNTQRRPLCHLCGNNFQSKSKLNRHLREVCEPKKLQEVTSYYDSQTEVLHSIDIQP